MEQWVPATFKFLFVVYSTVGSFLILLSIAATLVVSFKASRGLTLDYFISFNERWPP